MLERARVLQDQLVAWRRDFHMHPELGFQEIRTAARVAEVLRALGYSVSTAVGRTGVVAERGQGPPIIAIRADMDALPIQEDNEVSYASQVSGVMHACGHDAHTAIALGVATLLAEETFPGTIRFLFQPAEEVADEEGLSGAPRMVAAGVMRGVDAVLALHADPAGAVGEVYIQAGPASAGTDSFYVRIIGRGGHGAMPQDTVDPIYIAGHVILALHGIVSRRLDPGDAAVVSLGSIHAGHADNVIPGQVEMAGTIRFLTSEVRDVIRTEIERALEVAKALGGDYALRFKAGSLPMVNDAAVVEVLQEVATELLGDACLLPPDKPEMGAEDFGSFSSLAPGAMFGLGCRIEGDQRNAHNARYDIDEGCLPIGAAMLAETALRLLRR